MQTFLHKLVVFKLVHNSNFSHQKQFNAITIFFKLTLIGPYAVHV